MSDEIKEQTIILKEILKWIKVAGIDIVKEKISKEFSEENKILVYSLSDGKSRYEIENILNKKVTGQTVSNWWKAWSKQGLMEIHPDYKRRYKHIFNLEDFGITIPEIETQESVAPETETTEETASSEEVAAQETAPVETTEAPAEASAEEAATESEKKEVQDE